MRAQLNRLVLYVFYPCILFRVVADTPITAELLSVPLLVGTGTLVSGALLYVLLCLLAPLGRGLTDPTRAVLMLGGMFGNTFSISAQGTDVFFNRGPCATRRVRRYAGNDAVHLEPRRVDCDASRFPLRKTGAVSVVDAHRSVATATVGVRARVRAARN